MQIKIIPLALGYSLFVKLLKNAEELMKANAGKIDRTIRVVVGLILLALVVVGPKTLWGLIGLVPLLTGLVGFCPLYRLIGLNTCPLDKP